MTSIHTPPIVATCPRCSNIHGREIPTANKGVDTFYCPVCVFVWTKKAEEVDPAVRKP